MCNLVHSREMKTQKFTQGRFYEIQMTAINIQLPKQSQTKSDYILKCQSTDKTQMFYTLAPQVYMKKPSGDILQDSPNE